MELTRRDLLKWTGLSAAGLLLPSTAKAVTKKKLPQVQRVKIAPWWHNHDFSDETECCCWHRNWQLCFGEAGSDVALEMYRTLLLSVNSTDWPTESDRLKVVCVEWMVPPRKLTACLCERLASWNMIPARTLEGMSKAPLYRSLDFAEHFRFAPDCEWEIAAPPQGVEFWRAAYDARVLVLCSPSYGDNPISAGVC